MNNYHGCDENYIEKSSILQNNTNGSNIINLLKNYTLFQQIINPELRHNLSVNFFNSFFFFVKF